jgi:allantoinase
LDEFPAARLEDLQAAASVLARKNRPLLAHAELVGLQRKVVASTTRYTDYLATRPPEWETAAIQLMINLCRESGCPVHIVHLANGEALPLIAAAKQEGLPITVESCPHYLHFTAEEIPDGDTRFKCAPPIRSAEHRELLWSGLQQGLIDTIGSDHSPCPPAMKGLETGDFMAAWGGISSLQLTLSVIWTEAKKRNIPLDRIFNWLSAAPARLVQLDKRKGRIELGFDADLVVLDPDAQWVVHGEQLQHRHSVTPYEIARLHGVVRRTYLRGNLAYHDGNLFEAFGRPLLTSA